VTGNGLARAALCGAGGAFLVLAFAQDPEPAKTLIPGKGSDLTTARCATCHDAQHITRAKLSRGEWEFNIKNMIERGAPIAPGEIPVILEYLATYYNRDKPAPAPSPDTLASGGDDPVQKLLNANACNGCHSIDKRVVGPSFREVAAKYAGDRSAAARLATKIRGGGQGVWGAVPMPPNPGLPEAELQRLAAWVLQQK
jgi:cytochrome c551/c552